MMLKTLYKCYKGFLYICLLQTMLTRHDATVANDIANAMIRMSILEFVDLIFIDPSEWMLLCVHHVLMLCYFILWRVGGSGSCSIAIKIQVIPIVLFRILINQRLHVFSQSEKALVLFSQFAAPGVLLPFWVLYTIPFMHTFIVSAALVAMCVFIAIVFASEAQRSHDFMMFYSWKPKNSDKTILYELWQIT